VTRYIEFTTEGGGSLLVEVEDEEVEPSPGVAKAGLLEKPKDTVAKAEKTFDDAVKTVIGQNVRSLSAALEGLKTPPSEVEFSFGLKATGEIGNVAIAKIGGEATFQLKLVWKPAEKSSADGESPPETSGEIIGRAERELGAD